MSDEVIIEAPKATIYVERKVQVRDYESMVVGMHYPVDLPLPEQFGERGADYLAAVDGAIKSAYVTVKAHIFEQLGLEFEDRNGVLIEKVAAKFEGAAEVQTNVRPLRAPDKKAAGQPESCASCGGTEFYDNRDRKASGEYKATYPDFKCRKQGCGKGIWLQKRGS